MENRQSHRSPAWPSALVGNARRRVMTERSEQMTEEASCL